MASADTAIYEPLNPEQRRREENVPIGLKNIGDTAYLNSILQVLFNIPAVFREVMNHIPGESNRHCANIVDSLRRLFSQLTLLNRKYADP